MTAIARQAAVLIENARLYEQEQKQRQRAETLLQAASAASSSLSLKKVLIKLCQSVVDLTVGDRCSIFLSEEGEQSAIPIMSLGIRTPLCGRGSRRRASPHRRSGHPSSTPSLEPVIEEHVPGQAPARLLGGDVQRKVAGLYPLVHRERT
jgi:GAF domain-containing protein